jgi:hypothetical protein
MLKIKTSLLVLTLLLISSLFSVNAYEIEYEISEGLELTKNTSGESFDGYILFTPWLSKKTFLLDNNGEVVNQWKSRYLRGIPVYLLENGNLLRADTNIIRTPPQFFFTGGCTGQVEMFDWEGNVIWNFIFVNLTHCLHNDIEPLPNGNILMSVWEYKRYTEAINVGINTENLALGGMMVDRIIEVEPTYPKGGKIVWQWSIWDHLIQDFDITKDNYGIVANHPELIDINSKGRTIKGVQGTLFFMKKTDFSHFNSIDYNEKLDQILLSSRYLNEIYIIDHSTTTEEAAGHTGGNSGKGGDILYRWGNPLNYHAGNASDQQLFLQHDARWVKTGYPGEGQITIFNNGVGRPEEDYSSIEEIIPPVDENGSYFLEPGFAYGPEDPIWNYTAKNPSDFYSITMSGAQRLPDGNTLICSGGQSKFFIVTPEKEIVWEYVNRFPIPDSFFSFVFKTQYYEKEYLDFHVLTNK